MQQNRKTSITPKSLSRAQQRASLVKFARITCDNNKCMRRAREASKMFIEGLVTSSVKIFYTFNDMDINNNFFFFISLNKLLNPAYDE